MKWPRIIAGSVAILVGLVSFLVPTQGWVTFSLLFLGAGLCVWGAWLS